ncbi:hypothetical protein D3C81_1699860 [compost metagenome]
MGKIIQVGGGQLEAAQEVVVDQHRRHCDGDTHASGHQRRANRPGHGFQAGGAGRADALERFHDAPHGAEQADEGRGAADTRDYREAGFQ